MLVVIHITAETPQLEQGRGTSAVSPCEVLIPAQLVTE